MLYLNPNQILGIKIPSQCKEYAEQKKTQGNIGIAYSKIMRIILEDIPKGYVHIFTTNGEDLYYRVKPILVQDVYDSFAGTTDPVTEQVKKLNALFDEIFNLPAQHQQRVYLHKSVLYGLSNAEIREMIQMKLSHTFTVQAVTEYPSHSSETRSFVATGYIKEASSNLADCRKTTFHTPSAESQTEPEEKSSSSFYENAYLRWIKEKLIRPSAGDPTNPERIPERSNYVSFSGTERTQPYALGRYFPAISPELASVYLNYDPATLRQELQKFETNTANRETHIKCQYLMQKIQEEMSAAQNLRRQYDPDHLKAIMMMRSLPEECADVDHKNKVEALRVFKLGEESSDFQTWVKESIKDHPNLNAIAFIVRHENNARIEAKISSDYPNLH